MYAGASTNALFVDDLELSHTIPLDPTLYPSEPGVQLLEESPGLCPVQQNYNHGIWVQIERQTTDICHGHAVHRSLLTCTCR